MTSNWYAGILVLDQVNRTARKERKGNMGNNLNYMVWDQDLQEYVGTLPDGSKVHVSGDVWSEVEQDGVKEQELVNPTTWANCLDDEKVYIEKEEK